jgi:eukaryotic-like serine/threonine-protein kinase
MSLSHPSQGELITDPFLGKTIAGRFTIKAFLGRGASGSVYLADQEATGREIALKLLSVNSLDPKARERFAREAKIAAKISHPNTVTVYDFGQDGEQLFIAMEYLSGQPLSEKLKQGPLTSSETIHIAQQILSSLEDAQQHGIVHRDVKPENIFLAKRGPQEIVKVLDFGIAKTRQGGSGLTTEGTTYGTPAYMSPEQVCGEELDGRSDLYSLGVVMYEMLCGKRPFVGNSSMEIASKHIHEPLPPLFSQKPELREVPSLVKIVERATAKKAGSRFANAKEMSQALSQVFSSAPAPTEKPLFLALGISVALFLGAVGYRVTRVPSASVLLISSGVVPVTLGGQDVGTTPTKREGLRSSEVIQIDSGPLRFEVGLQPGTTLIVLPSAEAK